MDPSEIKKFESRKWVKKPDFNIDKLSARSDRVVETILLDMSIQYLDLSDKRILNVGGGHGPEAEFLLKKGAKSVTLLDISQGQLENTLVRIQERHLEDLACIRGDAENLPFQDNSFDLGYIFMALHHFPNNIQAISEICRASKDVIFVDIMDSLLTRILTKFGFFEREWCGIEPNRLDQKNVENTLQRNNLSPTITYFFVAPVYTYNLALIRFLVSFFKLSSHLTSRNKTLGIICGNVAIINGKRI
jgi:SAM-dependent methyltransferase